MDKKKMHFAKLRDEKIKIKPPTKAQKRNQMSTYLRNMAGYKHTQLKNKSFEEIQMLFDKEMKRVNSFVPMDSEVVEGSDKKTESSRKETVSKKRAEIVPKDDEAVNVESLSIKYPIVDWKTHILAEDKMYYQIIRADGSEKYYKIFSAMLDDFDRQDLSNIYSSGINIQQQLQIAQKEEAGIQITQEEFEFMAAVDAHEETQREKVNNTSEDRLQQASTSGTQSDNAPIYDSDGSTEVPKDENCYDHDIFNMLTHEVQYTDLQTELDRIKEKLENCIIKKEKEYAVLWNNWYTKCEECKYDKISYNKAYNDM
ncbi:hypothetical protein Tco_0611445 [Tanacetum coccineum]